MEHIRVNIINVAIIGTASLLFFWAASYALVFFAGRNIPVLSAVATAIIGIIPAMASF